MLLFFSVIYFFLLSFSPSFIIYSCESEHISSPNTRLSVCFHWQYSRLFAVRRFPPHTSTTWDDCQPFKGIVRGSYYCVRMIMICTVVFHFHSEFITTISTMKSQQHVIFRNAPSMTSNSYGRYMKSSLKIHKCFKSFTTNGMDFYSIGTDFAE